VADGEQLGDGGSSGVWNIDGSGGIVGRRYQQKPNRFGATLLGSVSWLQQDRFVVQITAAGFVVPDDAALRLATGVFMRLRAR